MSDDLVKKLLESLTPDQKASLVDSLLNDNVKRDVPEMKEEAPPSNPSSNVNEDFTVTRGDDFLEKRKTPVRANKNQWVDDGEDRDPDFDPAKFERMGKTSRNRGKAKRERLSVMSAARLLGMNANLVHGEYIRCNRCTGR